MAQMQHQAMQKALAMNSAMLAHQPVLGVQSLHVTSPVEQALQQLVQPDSQAQGAPQEPSAVTTTPHPKQQQTERQAAPRPVVVREVKPGGRRQASPQERVARNTMAAEPRRDSKGAPEVERSAGSVFARLGSAGDQPVASTSVRPSRPITGEPDLGRKLLQASAAKPAKSQPSKTAMPYRTLGSALAAAVREQAEPDQRGKQVPDELWPCRTLCVCAGKVKPWKSVYYEALSLTEDCSTMVGAESTTAARFKA